MVIFCRIFYNNIGHIDIWCIFAVFSITRRSRSDVVHSLPDSWLAMTWLMWPWWMMIPKEDLTGVILVSEDGFWRLDWCDSGYWGGFLETWLMWLWLLRRPFRDLTDVTLVSNDILRRLDWCDSGVWGCLLETWLIWLWPLKLTNWGRNFWWWVNLKMPTSELPTSRQS